MLAAALAAVFSLAHLLGLRAYTCTFSGTAPAAGELPGAVATALGVGYAVLYLAAVGVVPTLILAAGFLGVVARPRPPAHPRGPRPRRARP